MRIIGRTEEEVKKIKNIIESKKTPGARVLRDRLYPVKVDNVNRTAIIDHGQSGPDILGPSPSRPPCDRLAAVLTA